METTTNGVRYEWYLHGPDGAGFILFPNEQHTQEDVKNAKKELRTSQDVVSLRLATDADLDDQFKKDYFRFCKHLPWYHIEQDGKLIRRERKRGLTPEQFYIQHVLPNVEKYQKIHTSDPLYK